MIGVPICNEDSRELPVASRSPPARCDVTIVGAGITGQATARHLTKAGLDVHVFEKVWIGDGATSRNAGSCTISPPVTVSQLLASGDTSARRQVHWYQRAVDAAEDMAAKIAPLNCGNIEFRRIGNLRLAGTRAQEDTLREAPGIFAPMGARRHFIPGKCLNPPAGHGFRAGLRHRTSASLHPGRPHCGFATAALAPGADISQATAVLSVDPVALGTKLKGSDFQTEARALEIATNGSAGRTLSPFCDILAPAGSNILVIEPFADNVPLGGLDRGTSAATRFRFPHCVRVIEGNRLLSDRRSALSRIVEFEVCANWFRERTQALFAGVEVPAVQSCWRGVLGVAANKLPRLGRLDVSATNSPPFFL